MLQYHGIKVRGVLGGIAIPESVNSVPAGGPNVARYGQTLIDAASELPIPWTVSIGRPRSGPIVGGAAAAGNQAECEADPDPSTCFARIRFGAEAAEQVVTVDCGLGCRVPIFGARVKVDVFQDIASSLTTPPITSPGNIPIALTPGLASGPATPLTRTLFVGNVNAGVTTAKFVLPPYTARVEHSFRVAGAVAGLRTLRFFSRNGAASDTEYSFTGANRRDPEYPEWPGALPVPYDASKVQLTNDGGATMTSVRFICELAL
jgi:hypothetical protein